MLDTGGERLKLLEEIAEEAAYLSGYRVSGERSERRRLEAKDRLQHLFHRLDLLESRAC
jgi:hypothetical protein